MGTNVTLPPTTEHWRKAPHRKKKVSRQDVVQEVVRMVEVAMGARRHWRANNGADEQVQCVEER
jgi:hypothetical protein